MSSLCPENSGPTRRELLALLPSIPLLAGAAQSDSGWIANTWRELHLDAHFGQVQAPYESFDAANTARVLEEAGFRMVSFFAVDGTGFSYYPTKLGTVHPGLKRDFTGEMAAALKKRGIRILPYVSVGPDRRYHEQHPDWVLTRATPEPRRDQQMMCLSSPWVEEVHIPQLREIVDRCGADGFFLDNLLSKFTRGPCYCRYCRESFASDVGGEIPVKDGDPKVPALHRWLSERMARYADKVTAALAGTKPGLAYVFTHTWVSRNPVQPPPSVKQLVWEPAPPYPGVLSLDFSLEGRYLSTQRGIENWSCMATRGNGWGDYSVRDPEAFLHEAATLLAHGGRPYLADDSYPSGNPEPAVYRVYGEVNRRTEDLEPYVRGAVPVRDTAVLLSADSMWSKLPLIPPANWLGVPSSAGVAGAHKVLTESHVQFGILNSSTLIGTLSEYKALILPEQCFLSRAECESIRRFVRSGGVLLATGDTGTQPEFGLADVLGIRHQGTVDVRRAFVRCDAELVEVSGTYSRVEATTAKVRAGLLPPIGSKQSPAETTEGPAVTIQSFGDGMAVYCVLPVFSAYHQDGTAALRRFACWMLDIIYPAASRSFALENAPLNVEAVLNSRGADRFLHLLNFTGDRRLVGAQRVQGFSKVDDIHVSIRMARPRRVSNVPSGKNIPFRWARGRLVFTADPLERHAVYMIEG